MTTNKTTKRHSPVKAEEKRTDKTEPYEYLKADVDPRGAPATIPTPTPKKEFWRVYFNAADQFPFLVAVDNGTIASQIRVQWCQFCGVKSINGNTDLENSTNVYARFFSEHSVGLAAERRAVENEPTWWLELEAYAVFEEGGVSFWGDKLP